MGYLSTLLSPSARDRAGPKNGAVSMATVNVDPLGAVSVTADVPVQGQGHETVISQIVAEQLGLQPEDISVNLEIDTAKDQWSIASGNYSCRFSPGAAVAVHLAAVRIREKLARIAARQLNILPDDIEFADGKVRSRGNPDNAVSFGARRRHGTLVAGPCCPTAWRRACVKPPCGIRRELEPPDNADRINTSLTYGFVFDICGVEIEPSIGAVRVDRYYSMHDAGKLLNPLLAEGQIQGAFVQGLAAALYEEFIYDETAFSSPAVLPITWCRLPARFRRSTTMHMESPSPFTPLGAKGLAEGNCMSVPACIANGIADALRLKEVQLPATPPRIFERIASIR